MRLRRRSASGPRSALQTPSSTEARRERLATTRSTSSSAPTSTTSFYQCSLDDSPWQSCFDEEFITDLSDGPHTFSARARFNGSVDQTPVERSFVVDTSAPDTLITSGPSGTVRASTQEFEFESDQDDATFRCSFDGSPLTSCSSPARYDLLKDGDHRFTVVAANVRTDPTPAVREFTIEGREPDTTITSGPSGTVSSASQAFEFTSDQPEAEFRCTIDDAAPFNCESPKAYRALSDGPHTFGVAATNVGRTDATPAQRSFVVDTTSPATSITSSPGSLTNNASPSFSFGSPEEDALFECRMDPGQDSEWMGCSSPQAYSALTDGDHQFEVRAVDPSGNRDSSPSSRLFTIDATPPELSIDSGPDGSITDSDPRFEYSAETGATTVCSLDEGTPAFAPCASPRDHHAATPLADGPHTFRVRSTDRAGNTVTQTRDFRVDTVCPRG